MRRISKLVVVLLCATMILSTVSGCKHAIRNTIAPIP